MIGTMIRTLPVLAAILLLAGCTATPADEEQSSDCLTVSDAVQAALQAGIDTPDVDLGAMAAVASPSEEDVWYVSATYQTPDDDGTATWLTKQNPTTADDADFLSVDEVAENLSGFDRVQDGTSQTPGAVAATACLD